MYKRQAEELDVLVTGTPELDFDELAQATQYDGGYRGDHPTIKAFWAAVRDMPPEEQRRLLMFVTGSKKVGCYVLLFFFFAGAGFVVDCGGGDIGVTDVDVLLFRTICWWCWRQVALVLIPFIASILSRRRCVCIFAPTVRPPAGSACGQRTLPNAKVMLVLFLVALRCKIKMCFSCRSELKHTCCGWDTPDC